MIKAALFDMDGTLYDSMPNHARAWMRVMCDIGVDAREEEFYIFEGRTGASVINEMIQRQFGRPATDDEKLDYYALKARYFVEQPAVEVMPGAKELVDMLRSKGIVTVLVTGSGQNSLLNRLDEDFPGAFPPEMRVTSASVTKGKPDPEPYLKGLELAGVEASEAIAIDNAPLGVESAHRAGIHTLGVATGPFPPSVLAEAGADEAFSSLRQIYQKYCDDL